MGIIILFGFKASDRLDEGAMLAERASQQLKAKAISSGNKQEAALLLQVLFYSMRCNFADMAAGVQGAS